MQLSDTNNKRLQELNCDYSAKVLVNRLDLSFFCFPNLAVEASVMVSGPVYVRRGATLTCTVWVNASLQVLGEINTVADWIKENLRLINNNSTNISGTISNGSSFETNVTFVPLQFSDSGNYSCEVTLVSIATGNVVLTRSSMVIFDVEGKFMAIARVGRSSWYVLYVTIYSQLYYFRHNITWSKY